MLNQKWLHTIRWKFIFFGMTSAAATALALYLGDTLARYLIAYPPFIRPLSWIVNTIGSTPVMVVGGIAGFITMFFMMSGSTIRYMEEIHETLHEMGEGKLDNKLSVRSGDELGRIAGSINRVSSELQQSLEEITSGLEALAGGQFDYQIPVRTGELARVAKSINLMSAQLSRSIEDERNAEKTKNDLITGVSHDLRTPLTSVLGFLEVIDQDRYKDEVELRHYVNIAYEKSKSLLKLVEDLFEYTRIAGGLPLNKVELDISDFVSQLAEEYSLTFEKASMTCRIKEAPESLIILADGDMLVRSFENLLTNAIRYGHEGRYVDIVIARMANKAVIRFINYGEPIPQHDLPYLFDRFYRVEQSRSKETGGTGLGLAITKSIIEAHGGVIRAESGREQTVFEAALPLYTA
ncbi:Adaptive-response sensory-kinase SasA [Paenibacillus plantiphilus]|uniref:histidine kinase n=1 Tax=Paenibacillus plantiphilus TaxID=2905650 RepID=A0ABM9BTE6_9BACL|nr:ATP-binding protein [Paenibacillus plantiphilus]CAH1193495.1 Adaptive-response sensory-kinase SasA [Paenibacillus plantiphilus]